MGQRLSRLVSGFGNLGRDAKLLLLSNTIGSIAWGNYSCWQLYLKHAGYGGTGVGTYSLIQGLSMTMLAVPSGIAADRVRRKRLAALGSIMAAASTLVVLWSTSMVALISSALVAGISWAISGPSWNSLFAETVQESGMEAGYGLNAFLSSVFMAIGSAAGWIPEVFVSRLGLTYFESYRLFLLLPVALQLISVVPLVAVRESFVPSGQAHPLKLSVGRIAVKFAVANALVGFGAGLSIPLMGYYLSVKFGVESGPIGTLFALSSILGAPSYLAGAPLASRIGVVKGVVIPQAISIPLLILIPFSPSFAVVGALWIPRTMLMNMVNPLISAFTMRLTPEEERGNVSAITQIAWNLPNSVSQQIGGATMDRVLDAPILLTSGIYMVYVSAFYFLFRREERMN